MRERLPGMLAQNCFAQLKINKEHTVDSLLKGDKILNLVPSTGNEVVRYLRKNHLYSML